MRRLLVTLAPALAMLLVLMGSGLASAHTTTVHRSPTFTCGSDFCDGIEPAGASCSGSSIRVFDAPMIAHNGTTVGHLYLYEFPGCNVPEWGTYHLSSAIESAQVYSTRRNTTDDPKEYSTLTFNPSTGVYHDAQMVGCDYDYPAPSDNFLAGLDWRDNQGFLLHTNTSTNVAPVC